MNTYLRDISRNQPLTSEQEQTLAQLARQGDQQARHQLIEANLLLVVNIARQYLRSDVEILDLIQEGNIGLIKAVDMFDPTKGNRLSTLARFWVQKYILRFLRNEQDETVSLDMEIKYGSETLLLSDTIEDQNTTLGDASFEHIETTLERQEEYQRLREGLDRLSEREQEVLRLLYGIDQRRCYSVTDVAHILEISKVRVCQLRDRALRKLL